MSFRNRAKVASVLHHDAAGPKLPALSSHLGTEPGAFSLFQSPLAYMAMVYKGPCNLILLIRCHLREEQAMFESSAVSN